MGAHVARQIEQFVGGEIGGGDAMQHLLIGGIGRFRRRAVFGDQGLDCRPVDDVERIERAGARITRIDGGGVDDEHVLDQHPEPVGDEWRGLGRTRNAEIASMARGARGAARR